MTKTINWAVAVDGDFASGPDWVGGSEPTKTEIANLPTFDGSPYTVTFDTPPGGKKGRTPTMIGGLEIGTGVTFDVEEFLQVGAVKAGTPQGGQITNDGTIKISGYALKVFSTFTNDGLIMFSGGVITGGNVVGEIPQFTNNGSVELSSNGNFSSIASFDNKGILSGSGTINSAELINNGTIEGGNTAGFYSGLLLAVASTDTVTNYGLIQAIAGNTINIFCDVSGGGTILINGGTFLVADLINSGGKFSANITFGASASSTFILANTEEGATNYTGTISGFSKTGKSAIDLQDMVGSGSAVVSYTGTKKGGVLKITGDGHSDTIAFAGNYLGVTFSANMTSAGTAVTASKSGGGNIVDPSAPAPSVVHFASAMAAMAGHGVPGLIDARTFNDGRQMTLAAPRFALA